MKNIFNIKANYNFLESLANWTLQKYGSDLIFLSQVTILLPSRRSCRVIKEIFLKQSEKNAIILPKIEAIGDIDFDDIGLSLLTPDQIDENNLVNFNELIGRPTSALKYRCLLVEEIRKFNEKTHLFGKNLNSNQINLIASNLEDFLNEVEREELDLDNLENIDDSDLASHKQKILQFLRHFGSNWRQNLQKNNLKSPFSHQKDMINFGAKFLQENDKKNARENNNKPKFPIIAAGSTGSVKATSNLLKVISKLENGFVILAGLDCELSADIFDSLSDNHPQFMLKKLLQNLEIDRKAVQNIEFEQFKQKDDSILKLTSYAFLPAKETAIWNKIDDLAANSCQNLTLIECKNNFDEASMIALIMVQMLQEEGKNIALITNNSTLALTVKEILQRFNINIDNSKNNKLAKSHFANYLLSIAAFSQNANFLNYNFKISNLLGILKHNLTRCGFDDDFYQRNLTLFEMAILRQNFSLKSFDLIAQKIADFGNDDLKIWFNKIRETLENFGKNNYGGNFLAMILANFDCAKNLSKNGQNQEQLSSLNGIEEFLDFIEELKIQAPNFMVENEIYCQILTDFLGGYSYEQKANHHPRLHILTPIEARLMNFDVMIVSGLNEGEFISQKTTQNWLSSRMRLDFGLPDFTRKIGVHAFDFCNYLGNKEVFLTRSLSSNNAPTAEIRFLMKIKTLLKATKNQPLDRGNYWHFLLNNFSGIEAKLTEKSLQTNNNSIANPPLGARLKKVSVTDISKWIRDPYYIYAKRILQLKALNKIDEEASFASFGNFVHKVLEEFVKNRDNIPNEPKSELLEKIRPEVLLNIYAKKYFCEYFPNPENHLLWWPKWENIANWFIINENHLKKRLKTTITELSANIIIDNLEITTKIDRINQDHGNNIEIIDYKTGFVPTKSDVKQGLEPQLPIESLIFLSNQKLDLDLIKKLQYYSLKGRDQNKITNLDDPQKLIEAANIGLRQLIEIFNNNQTPFLKAPNPEIYKENEYSHLARIEL